jgi:hypothetical protein
MATVSMGIQLLYRSDQLRPQRIEVDITNQFQQIIIFLTEDGFVSVLKKVAISPIPSVETHHVSSKNLSHDGCNGSISGPQQKVQMV